MSLPLYKLTGKCQFRWDAEQEDAFVNLKESLTKAPVLSLPNSRDDFILDTDASNDAIGAELIQVQAGAEKVVSYGSFALTKEQRKYCTTRKELLAVVRFTRQYRHYLLGKKFTVRTDHSSLTWLMNFKEPQGQLARWLEELSQYDMVVVHRPGRKHANADALSRQSGGGECLEYQGMPDLESLPCGGCKYCRKAHKNWGKFLEEVDDVVPLAGRVRRTQTDSDPNIESEEIPATQDTDEKVTVSNTLRDRQREDPDFQPLVEWLLESKIPSEGDLYILSKEAKYYWVNRELFFIHKSIIFRRDPKQGNVQALIPAKLREEMMEMCHKIPMAAHQGIERTRLAMKSKYYWRGMNRDISKYVGSCQECNRYKTGGPRPRYEMTPYHAGIPMERVHLDFLGPLPRTDRGNVYVLMMVDQFTKWIECIPLPSQTAEVTAEAAVNHFFSRFGFPLHILTDRGSNFESKLFSNMCEILKIQKDRTTAYRPSANGQVERGNRTLMDAVRCFVGKDNKSWDTFVPQIAGAMRASINRSTGLTPNKMMLGREVVAPAELVFPLGECVNLQPDPVDPETYVDALERNLQQAFLTAREKLKTTQKIMKRDYDVKIRRREYTEGDMVFVLNNSVKKGRSRKLAPKCRDPD